MSQRTGAASTVTREGSVFISQFGTHERRDRESGGRRPSTRTSSTSTCGLLCLIKLKSEREEAFDCQPALGPSSCCLPSQAARCKAKAAMDSASSTPPSWRDWPGFRFAQNRGRRLCHVFLRIELLSCYAMHELGGSWPTARCIWLDLAAALPYA